jgi:hypothetical protein
MKKIIIVFSIIALFGIISVSCESNTYTEIATVKNPTYTINIEPVFRQNCIGCHNINGTSIPLDTYVDVKDNCSTENNGRILCYIDNPANCGKPASKLMPPIGRMPQTTIDMIKLWAAQNYPQ